MPPIPPTLQRAPRRCALFIAALLCISQLRADDTATVRVSETTLFDDMECFKIETPSATYLFGKRGAGFAGIVDPKGCDWISHHHGGQALEEYRGLPKCGQPVKYFHCGYGFGQYTNDNWFSSTVTLHEPAHVRIHCETAHSVEAMQVNQLAGLPKPYNQFREAYGYGLGVEMRTTLSKGDLPGSLGQFGWYGIATTHCDIDPRERTVTLLLAQHLPFDQHRLFSKFNALFYSSLD